MGDLELPSIAEAIYAEPLDTAGAHPNKRPNRTSGRKSRSGDVAQLLTIAIQALQNIRENALNVNADMPKHERERLLIAPLSDAGLAVRSVEEALEMLRRGRS